MGNQNVDYKKAGASADTGEGGSDAIRPYVNGEGGTAAVFNRSPENLRTRTEVVRKELEALKYLIDADRATLVTSTGSLLWYGLTAGANQGKLTIQGGGTLTIRPYLSTVASTQAKAVIRGVKISTVAVQNGVVVPPRAYSGANKVSVELTGSDGAALSAVVAEGADPADNFVLTINTNAATGTTKQQLVDYLNTSTDPGPVAFRNIGLTASVDSGVGADIIAPGVTTFGDTDSQVLSGAVDAERHDITSAGLSTFFATAGNALVEGDVLCIWYDSLVADGSYGGRRQSIPDSPESSTNVDNNLFLLRNNPERLAYAIPICRVTAGNLVFVDGTVVAPNAAVFPGGTSADNVAYAGGDNWRDGTNNPATTVEAQLDKIITDLAGVASGGGAAKIGIDALVEWADGTVNPAGGLRTAINNIILQLAGDAGASKIGMDGSDDPWADGTVIDPGTVYSVLNGFVSALRGTGGASKIGIDPLAIWKDGTTNVSTTLRAAVNKIIADLAANTGAAKVGNTPTSTVTSASVQGAINELDTKKGGLATNNSWTGTQTITPADDFTPGLKSDTQSSTGFRLLAEWKLETTYARLYAENAFSAEALLFTINAKWASGLDDDQGGTVTAFTNDSGLDPSFIFRIDKNGITAGNLIWAQNHDYFFPSEVAPFDNYENFVTGDADILPSASVAVTYRSMRKIFDRAASVNIKFTVSAAFAAGATLADITASVDPGWGHINIIDPANEVVLQATKVSGGVYSTAYVSITTAGLIVTHTALASGDTLNICGEYPLG